MSKVEMIAVEPCNGNHPGDRFTVSEREAAQLEDKGLAKMIGPQKNKMATSAENKAAPTKAAGKGARSSASPAARASAKKTAPRSGIGARRRKTGG